MADADPRKMINVHDAKTHFSKLSRPRPCRRGDSPSQQAGKPSAKLGIAIDKPSRQAAAEAGRSSKSAVPFPIPSGSMPLPESELELWEGQRLEKYGL